MANSEWVLGVHMQNFQNLYNAEIRNGYYCCCDISYLDVGCVNNLTNLNVAACTSECEPFFDLRFKVCFANGTCFSMTNEIPCINNISATCVSLLPARLHSEMSMTDIINVSA